MSIKSNDDYDGILTVTMPHKKQTVEITLLPLGPDGKKDVSSRNKIPKLTFHLDKFEELAEFATKLDVKLREKQLDSLSDFRIFNDTKTVTLDSTHEKPWLLNNLEVHINDIKYTVDVNNNYLHKGNTKFRKKKYAEAITFYTESMRRYPDQSMSLNNRSLCHFKNEENKKSADDCTLFLKLFDKTSKYSNSKNIVNPSVIGKIYIRRARSYLKLAIELEEKIKNSRAIESDDPKDVQGVKKDFNYYVGYLGKSEEDFVAAGANKFKKEEDSAYSILLEKFEQNGLVPL